MSYPLLCETSPPVPASGSQPSRSASYKSKLYAEEPEAPTSTLFELFQSSVKAHASQPALGYRPIDGAGKATEYQFYTYQETEHKIQAVASALHHAGVQKRQRVAVYGQNSCEWMIILQACSRMGYVLVPLYDTLGETAIEYIIDHSEAVFIAASHAKLPQLAAAIPNLKNLQPLLGVTVWGGPVDVSATAAVAKAGIEVTAFDDLLASGSGAAVVPADPPAPSDRSTIMYTSGTTGHPKGVMLTHASIVATVHSLRQYLTAHNVSLGPGDRMLSYLPLAHIFDRAMEEAFLAVGGAIGFWRGSLPGLVADIQALRPTHFHGVPRIFERIYMRVQDGIHHAGGIKRFLYNWAYSSKLARLRAGFPSRTAAPTWDALVFNKIKTVLGGEVKWVVSGGAPLAPHIEEFLRVAMCAPVVQGYGLTESCAASFIAAPDAFAQAHTIGPPQPVVEFAVESVPEMGYDGAGAPARGELLLRGRCLFTGYYKQPQQTEEVLMKDGWFHTGDVAEIQPDGAIKIIDRKKNIFKLSQGEYVAVEVVEAEYKKCPAIDQIWVYGDSVKSCLVAVAVPNERSLMEWAAAAGVAGDAEAVCATTEARAHIHTLLQAQARTSKLRRFEDVKSVHLHREPFAVEQELVTPTFKLRRPQLLAFFKDEVDAMYAHLKM